MSCKRCDALPCLNHDACASPWRLCTRLPRGCTRMPHRIDPLTRPSHPSISPQGSQSIISRSTELRMASSAPQRIPLHVTSATNRRTASLTRAGTAWGPQPLQSGLADVAVRRAPKIGPSLLAFRAPAASHEAALRKAISDGAKAARSLHEIWRAWPSKSSDRANGVCGFRINLNTRVCSVAFALCLCASNEVYQPQVGGRHQPPAM